MLAAARYLLDGRAHKAEAIEFVAASRTAAELAGNLLVVGGGAQEPPRRQR